MNKFNKLIAAIVGLLAIIIVEFLSIVPDGTQIETITQTVLAILTAFGVYQVRNTT